VVQTHDAKDQILALVSGCDATRLDLSAVEGYLLSRIDGATPWRLLREIGGIPPDEVDVCLAGWVEQGLLEVVGGSAKASPESQAHPAASVDATEAAKDAPAVVNIDESALDESLEIDLEVQRRILEYEASLARPYHELLGVPKGSEPKTVKRAYFKLSREFHPDRYFRKDIGPYGERLERIFKKVLEAHEMLSDPDLCQVENHEAAASTEAARPIASGASQGDAVLDANQATQGGTPRPLTKLERLRQRMPFKINHAALAERRARADEIFKAAQVSQQSGRLQEAEANIRIAITFDPSRAEFKEALGSLRIQAAGARAAKLLDKPSDRMSNGELFEALRLLEEVLPYRPHDPELNERAARICLRLGKLDDAWEYAETLLDRSPECAAAHTLVGRIRKEQGDGAGAIHAFETALKYDQDDLEARRGLASVRIGARDAARGGIS
jgi:curved DNA-binding protein CbpA